MMSYDQPSLTPVITPMPPSLGAPISSDASHLNTDISEELNGNVVSEVPDDKRDALKTSTLPTSEIPSATLTSANDEISVPSSIHSDRTKSHVADSFVQEDVDAAPTGLDLKSISNQETVSISENVELTEGEQVAFESRFGNDGSNNVLHEVQLSSFQTGIGCSAGNVHSDGTSSGIVEGNKMFLDITPDFGSEPGDGRLEIVSGQTNFIPTSQPGFSNNDVGFSTEAAPMVPQADNSTTIPNMHVPPMVAFVGRRPSVAKRSKGPRSRAKKGVSKASDAEKKSVTSFSCPVINCGKSFTKKFNLKAHMRLHTGVEPFSCSFPLCGRSFKWKSSLSFHENLHLRTKPEQEIQLGLAAAPATETAAAFPSQSSVPLISTTPSAVPSPHQAPTSTTVTTQFSNIPAQAIQSSTGIASSSQVFVQASASNVPSAPVDPVQHFAIAGQFKVEPETMTGEN